MDMMLTEHFVASIQTPLKTVAAGSKDVHIFLHELQPLAGVRQAFKRSATAPNCLAVSDTHVFAAQADKAVVHVYNRERGNHEATIPFNEKITCLATSADGLVLLLGTDGGRIMAWELATGRLVSSPQSHLQAVTCLAVDPTSNYVLSGSRDTNVLVWSLGSLLSFSSLGSIGQGAISPLHSLSSQRGVVASLSIGHGHGPANIAVSASEDQSVIVWDYQKGIALRTYLLRAIPRAIVLDRSDRGFYVTYEDGTVQVIDFHVDGQHVDTLHDKNIVTPVQPGDENLWGAEGQELGEGLSLALNWEGTRLLSGHKSGKIASWDVGKGSFISIVESLPGTATNIVMAPVQGLLNKPAHTLRLTEVLKPRISSSEAEGVVPGDYALSAQIATKPHAGLVHATHTSASRRRSRFQTALTQSSFPQSFLDRALAEMEGCITATSKHTDGDLVQKEGNKEQLDKTNAQNEQLQRQVEQLQKLQKASFLQLREKNRALSTLVAEQGRLAEIAKAEHGWNIVDANVEWTKYQQRQKGKSANGDHKSEDEDMADGG